MKKSTLKLWGIPLLMAAILLYGLISALIWNGLGDIFACLVLIVPILTVVYKYYFNTAAERKRTTGSLKRGFLKPAMPIANGQQQEVNADAVF